MLPDRLLAGAYPGHTDPAEHQVRIHSLVDADIRQFLNLMEEHETNYVGQPFVPYFYVVAAWVPAVRMTGEQQRFVRKWPTGRVEA